MDHRYSRLIKLACGGAMMLAVLIVHPGSWEEKAGARAKSVEPLMGAFFQVEVGGKPIGTFSTCSGIGSVNEVVEHKAATDKGKEMVQKVPGRLKWSDVTLARGLTTDMSLTEWRQQVIDGRMAEARKPCVITVLDRSGQPTATWELSNTWPSSLIVNQESAGNPLIEQMVLTCESVVRRK
ncbi:MAG: phage tail protein [Solirubrobacterales bacterium]